MTDTTIGSQRRGLDFPAVPSGRDLVDLDQFWSDWEPPIRRVAGAKLRTARVPRSLASADDAVQHTFLQLRERWQETDFLDVDPGRYCPGSVLPDYVRLQVKELKHRAGQFGTEPPWPNSRRRSLAPRSCSSSRRSSGTCATHWSSFRKGSAWPSS